MVLKLADDLNVFAFLSQHCSDSVYVCCFTYEGGKDHVDSMLHTKLQVLDVLFGNGRQVYGGTREVHSLLATQGAPVLNLAHKEVRTWRDKEPLIYAQRGYFHKGFYLGFAPPPLTNLLDLKGHESIINVDLAADFDYIGNVLVVQPEDLRTAVLLITII